MEHRKIPFDSILMNCHGINNCRTVFPESEDFDNSILEDGILIPLLVHAVDVEGSDAFVIVDGERRYRTLKKFREQLVREEGATGGWYDEVDCIVSRGSAETAQALNIVTALHRENPNYADTCKAISALVSRVGTQIEAANMLNVSQPYISYMCAIYKGLCQEVFEALRLGHINLSQAKKIAKQVDKDGNPIHNTQLEMLRAILGGGSAATPKEKGGRTKGELKKLRKQMEEDPMFHNVDPGHLSSIDMFLRWYFCEIELGELLFPDGEAPMTDEEREIGQAE